ncbi:hypothetical protein ACWC4A_53775, partial [Streptomyces mirabilis]
LPFAGRAIVLRGPLPVLLTALVTAAFGALSLGHGITFDHVFPSAELGVDKPSPHAYRDAAERMGIPTHGLAYFDDEPTFVQAAQSTGLQAHLFTTAADLAAYLRELGLPLTSMRSGVPGESSLTG